MATFTIYGRLPSLNQIIRWNRIVGRFKRRKFYGSVKRREIGNHIFAYLKKAQIAKFDGRVDISIRWVEPNAMRDYDNIASAVKFILDVLVETETIGGDSRKWIPRPVRHEYAVDKTDPRVEVTIDEYRDLESSEVKKSPLLPSSQELSQRSIVERARSIGAL